MRIKDAIPFIIERALEDEETVRDVCGTALAKIGGDEVVEAVANQWPDADEDFRGITTETLEHIHTDLSAEKCLEFFNMEDDVDTQLALGHAVLSQFIFDGIVPVWELVADA